MASAQDDANADASGPTHSVGLNRGVWAAVVVRASARCTDVILDRRKDELPPDQDPAIEPTD